MQVHRLELARALPVHDSAGAAHRLMAQGMGSDGLRALFFVENPRTVLVLAGDGAFEPRRLGAALSGHSHKAYTPRARVGDDWNFRVRLSAVSRNAGRHVGPMSDDQIHALIERLEAQGGFRVLQGEIEPEGGCTLRRGGRRVPLHPVLLAGALTVTDAEKFEAALAAGVGRKRTFGFGWLQVF